MTHSILSDPLLSSREWAIGLLFCVSTSEWEEVGVCAKSDVRVLFFCSYAVTRLFPGNRTERLRLLVLLLCVTYSPHHASLLQPFFHTNHLQHPHLCHLHKLVTFCLCMGKCHYFPGNWCSYRLCVSVCNLCYTTRLSRWSHQRREHLVLRKRELQHNKVPDLVFLLKWPCFFKKAEPCIQSYRSLKYVMFYCLSCGPVMSPGSTQCLAFWPFSPLLIRPPVRNASSRGLCVAPRSLPWTLGPGGFLSFILLPLPPPLADHMSVPLCCW